MTPDNAPSTLGNSNSANSSNDFDRWMEIAGDRHREIKKIHRRASDEEKARALEYANEAGEALFLIKKDRQEKHDEDRSKKGWVKWAKTELPFTYATANTYIRINYYWSDLEDLEERSIRAAIRRIQEIEGKTPRQRARRPREGPACGVHCRRDEIRAVRNRGQSQSRLRLLQ